MRGFPEQEQKAADHYFKLFREYSLSNQTAYPHAKGFYSLIRNGPNFNWKFKRVQNDANPDTKNYPYVLINASKTASPSHDFSDIQPDEMLSFDEPELEFVKNKLASFDSDPSIKVKITIGLTHYKLLTVDPDVSYSWEDIQAFRVKEDFSVCWNGVTNLNAPSFKAFQKVLLKEMELQNPDKGPVLTVYVQNPLENSSYSLKYHLIDNECILNHCYSHRILHNMINFSLEDDLGMRIRIYSRDLDPEMESLAGKLIKIIKADNVFGSKAVFTQRTKYVFSDRYVKLKRHVVVNDLKFTYAEHKEGARVEADWLIWI